MWDDPKIPTDFQQNPITSLPKVKSTFIPFGFNDEYIIEAINEIDPNSSTSNNFIIAGALVLGSVIVGVVRVRVRVRGSVKILVGGLLSGGGGGFCQEITSEGYQSL